MDVCYCMWCAAARKNKSRWKMMRGRSERGGVVAASAAGKAGDATVSQRLPRPRSMDVTTMFTVNRDTPPNIVTASLTHV